MDISVVIPTYNRFETLKRALTSIYSQSYMPKEVIIVDDGSTDNTSEIQTFFSQIQYFYQENSGVSSARNLGIQNATCEWIAFLDSDDTWHEDKLKEQVAFHQQNPTIEMSYTDELWIRDGRIINVPKKFSKYGGEIFEHCLSHCIIAPSATLIHKNLLDKIGLFDEALEVCEDYDLWLRVSCEHSIGLVDKKLITKYGGDTDQLSMKYWGMDRFRVIALEKLLENGKNEKKSSVILTTLLRKYALLLQGAKKHNKVVEIEMYSQKISYYQALFNNIFRKTLKYC